MAEFRGNRGVTRFVIASACVVVAVIAVAACSSSSTSTSASSLGIQCPATPDTCSTGSYPPGYSFPVSASYSSESDAGPSCGTCTPHCGAAPLASPTDALPAGACSTEGEACTMQVSHPQCFIGQQCGNGQYRCSCVNGNWTCEVTSQSKAICICEDAG